MPEPVLLTFKQAASRIDRTASTIQTWCYAGLASQKVGSRRMVRLDDLLAFHREKENVLRAQRGQSLLPPPGTLTDAEGGAQDRREATEDEPSTPAEVLNDLLKNFAAVREYAQLQAALKQTPAPCKDVPAFTEDQPGDVATLQAICASCPVLARCGAYARAAKIKTGFWAGVDRGRPSENPASTPQNERSRAIAADILRVAVDRAAS